MITISMITRAIKNIPYDIENMIFHIPDQFYALIFFKFTNLIINIKISSFE